MSTIIQILYCKYTKDYYIFYYPEDTPYRLVNFHFILAKRLAFKSIYYFNKKSFSIKNLKVISKYFSISYIIGLPYLIITGLSVFFRTMDLDECWSSISPYVNIKLVVYKGSLIRNMKKIGIKSLGQLRESKKKALEIVEKVDDVLEKGMMKTGKGVHGYALNTVTNTGVVSTTKIQKSTPDMLAWETYTSKPGYGYAQHFGPGNVQSYPIEKIKNVDVRNFLVEKSSYALLASSKAVYTNVGKSIVQNVGNKQSLIKITNEMSKNNKDFIEKHGGMKRIDETIEVGRVMQDLENNSGKLLMRLSNCDPDKRQDVFENYKDVYNDLIVYGDNKLLDGEYRLLAIKDKIDSIIKDFI